MDDTTFHLMIYVGIGYGIFWVGRWLKHKTTERARSENESDWMKFVQKQIDKIRNEPVDTCVTMAEKPTEPDDVDDNATYVNEDGTIRHRQVPTNQDLD